VRDVVGWGRLSGWSFVRPFASAADRAACSHALDAAGAAALADRSYRELSEGQKARVLLARALATGADLVLLDEPTAALDTVAEEAAMAQLARLAHEGGRAIVVVTHALDRAAEFADDVVFLDRDAGEVVIGTPAEVFTRTSFRRQLGEVRLENG
jgi:zinc transport system ATP-binding protein